MRHTANETSTTTLTRLIKALDAKHPVTVSYLKEEKDDAGRKTGRLVGTVRTLEIYDVVVSAAGDILLKAMDRETGESRSFRLDRIVSYTTHRTEYTVDRPAADEPKGRPARGLATVTVLYPVDCPPSPASSSSPTPSPPDPGRTAMQTCRRHPEAGRFIRTCSGCARELHDLQARNHAQAEARKALTLIGMHDARIIDVQATPTTLIVATHLPTAFGLEYGVDVFRLPTPAETDPDLADDYRLTPGQWLLIWQAGDHLDTTPDMVAAARRHLTRTGHAVPPTSTADAGPDETPIRVASLPTMPVLPATQTAANQASQTASDAFWDHAENCTDCFTSTAPVNPTTPCRDGARLNRRATDLATVAADFDDLDDWYRRGGRERQYANDWIAT